MSPLFDAKLKFSDAQSLAGLGPSTVVGDSELDFETCNFPESVNTGSAAVSALTDVHPDKGVGSPLVVRFVVAVAFTSGGGASVAFALCFDTATKAGGTSSGTIVVQTAPISVDLLTLGAYIPELKIPDQHAKFCNVNYVISGAAVGVAGKITAYVDIASGLRGR
jgi:hypothetical protein